MENSNTTCFILLEKPLTVTFTVDDEERGYDWANHVSEKHPNDNRKCNICDVLKDFSGLCGVPRSLSDSDIFAKFQDNDFSACDENLEPENRTDPSTNRCCDETHKSQAEKQETRLPDNTGNSCLLPGTKDERNRLPENRCSFEELAASLVLGDREEQNLILDVTSPKNSRPGTLIGSDNSFGVETPRRANGTVLPFAEHSHPSGSRSDDSKLKIEKIPLDLGYFTEEGNEGGRDEEECNDGIAGTSISHRLSANDNCCRDDVRSQSVVAKSQCVQSRSGILKHSRMSASFDISSSASNSLKENNSGADSYHFLSNSPSARNVAFFEPPISVYKWRFAVDFDGCQAMERVRAVTTHLCLPVHNVTRTDEHIENYSLPVTDQWRKTSVGLGADTSEAETARVNPAFVHDNVNEFFSRIKQELFQLRKADETIASRLLVLYGEIKQFKYVHNCHLYREMMEAAIDNEDKKDELFRHHVDTIPERLCATFKHWGLTRINLQRRRFSIF